ncbi:hypothetical protein PR048_008960 [Dryococelus australis]|uniref:Uncharacterized protein n=1 Tax=Dryococelus australis TaxID=614101 RepID=A0ABQ9HZD4_9NEOP|nr:hypothetical protein PR048_008960 [Dryococelus australis]
MAVCTHCSQSVAMFQVEIKDEIEIYDEVIELNAGSPRPAAVFDAHSSSNQVSVETSSSTVYCYDLCIHPPVCITHDSPDLTHRKIVKVKAPNTLVHNSPYPNLRTTVYVGYLALTETM